LSAVNGNGDTRLRRAEKNEEAFKAHNERHAELEEQGGVAAQEPVPFACECDDATCARAIAVPLGEYERAARRSDQFFVAPGHEDPTVEDIVQRYDRYILVSKPDLKRRR
jgi:hypothetical protein